MRRNSSWRALSYLLVRVRRNNMSASNQQTPAATTDASLKVRQRHALKIEHDGLRELKPDAQKTKSEQIADTVKDKVDEALATAESRV